MAVGVVDYQQTPGGTWVTGADPLGPRSQIGLCNACLSVTHQETDTCPTCSAQAPLFAQAPVAEPAGSRTSYRPRDYEQLSDPTARASQPRLALPATASEQHRNSTVTFANAEIVAVNDNDGQLFRFTPAVRIWDGQAKPAPGLLEAGLLSADGKARASLRDHQATGEAPDRVALAARRRTDVLVLEATHMPDGLVLDIRSPVGRGAWASLGYLMRDAAVKWLDIGPAEVEVGIHAGAATAANHPGSTLVPGQLFIADSLANGAGYASRLGRSLATVLDETDRHAAALSEHGQGQPCDSSCYQCLRDYSNRSWHPLLDWRLAVDLLDILFGRQPDHEAHRQRDLAALGAFATDFHLELVPDGPLPAVRANNGKTLHVSHPFEDTSPSSTAERVRGTRKEQPYARIASSYDLIRRPGSLVAGLLSGGS